MKSISAYKRGLKKVWRHWLSSRFDRALVEVSHLLKEWPDNPRLLIMWADLIQLQEKEEGPSLAGAKAAYQRAIDLDDNSAEALTEMGLFILAIEDDAQAAIPYFEKAAAVCRKFLEQALLGHAEACAELEQQSGATKILREVRQVQSHRAKSASGSNGIEPKRTKASMFMKRAKHS
jgi:tetratricopeptide (TPR) repeat protein